MYLLFVLLVIPITNAYYLCVYPSKNYYLSESASVMLGEKKRTNVKKSLRGMLNCAALDKNCTFDKTENSFLNPVLRDICTIETSFYSGRNSVLERVYNCIAS